MKKLILSLALVTLFVACDNAANTETDAKDSLDSIANAKKEIIDSSADRRKDIIDSTTERQKDIIDKADSLNERKDSVTR
jgi:hypothetical protein